MDRGGQARLMEVSQAGAVEKAGEMKGREVFVKIEGKVA